MNKYNKPMATRIRSNYPIWSRVLLWIDTHPRTVQAVMVGVVVGLWAIGSSMDYNDMMNR